MDICLFTTGCGIRDQEDSDGYIHKFKEKGFQDILYLIGTL